MGNTVKLEVVTPADLMYRGQVELVAVATHDGDEGYMPGHTWSCKLLKGDGKVRIKEPGDDCSYVLETKGGYIEIRDYFIVYVEDAKWITEKPKGAATIFNED